MSALADKNTRSVADGIENTMGRGLEGVYGAGQGRFGWKKIADRRAYEQDIAVPGLDEMVINLNDPKLSFRDIMAVTRLDEYFCKMVIKVGKEGKYTDQNYSTRLWDWFGNNAVYSHDVKAFESKIDTLRLNIGKDHITFE